MSFTTCLVVMTGGAVGTLLRYLGAFLMQPISRELPWGTIVINVTGSFLIGLFGTLTVASGRYPASENLRLFVMIGVCGGYTTFSSFSLQTLDLLRAGAATRAAMNMAFSLVLCVAAVAFGHAMAARINGGGQGVAQAAAGEDG